jgi:hypothetical protein
VSHKTARKKSHNTARKRMCSKRKVEGEARVLLEQRYPCSSNIHKT